MPLMHIQLDCDFGPVGTAVASYSRDSQFESRHRQFLFTIICIEKSKKEKEGKMVHLRNG